MRKIAFVLPILSISFLLFLPSKINAFSGIGTGESSDPYIITTCDQLQEIQEDPTANYALGQDIDCSDTINWNSGQGFAPIGGGQDFWGTLDGMGFTVYDLYINRPEDYSIGLFNTIEGGVVRNLTLERAYVRGYAKVGALVGQSSEGGPYTNILVINSEVISEDLYFDGSVGGIVGYSENSITFEECSFNGTVTGSNSVGGLVGQVYENGEESSVSIIDSYNDGTILGRNKVGGLLGSSNVVVDISNSYNVGNILGLYRVGGLVAYSYLDISITDSYNSGDISGYYRVGGLVGGVEEKVTLLRSYNDGSISSLIEDYDIGDIPTYFDSFICVGGLVGASWKAEMSKSYNEGSIQAIGGSRSVGGLLGCGGLTDIQESYNSGDITTQLIVSNGTLIDGVGGLLGVGVNGIIKNSYNKGSFNISAWESTSEDFYYDEYAPYLGGLAGVTIVSDIENSYSDTNVDMNDIGSSGIETAIGGLIGAEFMSNSMLSDVIDFLEKPFVVKVTEYFLKIVNSFANLVLENYSSSYEEVYVGGLIGRLDITSCEGEDCELDLAVLNNNWWSSVIVKAIGLVSSSNTPSSFGYDESTDHYERAINMDIFKTYSHKVYNTDPNWGFDTIWSNVYEEKGYPVLGIQDLVMPNAPVSTVASGTYTSSFNVSLSSSGSSIRYTINGSVPTCSTGTVYTGAIQISATSLLKAIGCVDDIGSSVSEFAYTITSVIDTTPSLTNLITKKSVVYTYDPASEIEDEEEESITEEVEEDDEESVVSFSIRIVDEQGNVLVGAKVLLDGKEYLTDEKGEIVVVNVDKGEYTMKITYDGKEFEKGIVLGENSEIYDVVVDIKNGFPWWIVIAGSVLIVSVVLYMGMKKENN